MQIDFIHLYVLAGESTCVNIVDGGKPMHYNLQRSLLYYSCYFPVHEPKMSLNPLSLSLSTTFTPLLSPLVFHCQVLPLVGESLAWNKPFADRSISVRHSVLGSLITSTRLHAINIQCGAEATTYSGELFLRAWSSS